MSGKKFTEILEAKPGLTFSLEVTPQFNLEELDNLAIYPDFIAVTWHAKSYDFTNMEIPPLRIAKRIKEKGFEVILHLSCDLITKEYLDEVLEYLQRQNIRNILAMQGEHFDSSQSYFQSTKELIIYVKQKTGNYFCIGVVGFPGGSERKFNHLKEKCESGADFVMTQAFFELAIFEDLIQKCKAKNINATVIPGLYIFETKEQLKRFAELCRVKTSDSLMTYVDSYGNGKYLMKDLVKELFEKQYTKHVHLFTLNNVKNAVDFVKDIKIVLHT